MLLAIQFPFSDLRGFVAGSSRLTVPGWPFPTPDSEFVRFMGPVRLRQGGGAEGWVGENELCTADRALRLARSPSYLPAGGGPRVPLRCAFRRFYFDGQAVGKFEVGIATRRYTRAPALDAAQTLALLRHLLELPVAVRQPDATARATVALARAGPRLADLYERASQRSPAAPSPEWWVQPGAPLLFCEFQSDEQLALPAAATAVELPGDYGFSLRLFRLPFAGGRMPLWMLGPVARAARPRARALRLYLMRLHAEHESLKLVLRAIRDGRVSAPRGSAESDALQRYLSDALRKIRETEQRSATQFDPEVASVARRTMAWMSPGQSEQLVTMLEALDVRPAVERGVRAYVEQRMNEGLAAPPTDRTIRLLCLSANPAETDRLRVDEELRTIKERLREAGALKRYDIEIELALRERDLPRVIMEYEPTLVHFSGHGEADGAIVLEDGQGRARSVPPARLAELFDIFRGQVRGVIFSACWSAPQAEALVREGGVPWVVVMRELISDTAARDFAAGFYRALGFGETLQRAFRLGRFELESDHPDEKETPQLTLADGVDAATLTF